MTDLWTDRHHTKCVYHGNTTKIININLDNGDAILECGCKISIHLSKLITII